MSTGFWNWKGDSLQTLTTLRHWLTGSGCNSNWWHGKDQHSSAHKRNNLEVLILRNSKIQFEMLATLPECSSKVSSSNSCNISTMKPTADGIYANLSNNKYLFNFFYLALIKILFEYRGVPSRIMRSAEQPCPRFMYDSLSLKRLSD